MAVPEQVRKQSEEIQRFYNPDTETEEVGAEANAEASEDERDSVVGESESNSAEEQANSETVRDHDSKDAEETFEHKYKTLQGMYNADIARLQAANKDYEGRVSQLEELISSFNTSPQNSAEASQEQQAQRFVTDTDVDEYGDSIEVMRKVSKEELHPVMSKMRQIEQQLSDLSTSLNSNVLPKVQDVARAQTESATERFWSGLTQRVPNWQQINNDPDFQSWLLQTDPLTGRTRQSFLEDAQKALSVDRVAAFFDTFAPQNSQPTGQNADTNGQPNRSASELEKQVAPGRSRSTSKPDDSSPKTYSQNEIKTFYNDVRAGKFKGREKERDRIERDIFAAQREGRITQHT
jgi:hypothetical protein